MLGTHWAIKIWKDADFWGFYLTCREMPNLNLLDTFLGSILQNSVSSENFS
jgi:hypothetical protein